MSVTKNLTLERQPRRFGFISWRQANERARERLKRLNLDIDVERPLLTYSRRHPAAHRDRPGVGGGYAGSGARRADREPRRARSRTAVRHHARSQGARHRHHLHHPLPRPSLPGRGPHLRVAQRPVGRHGADRGTAPPQADLADARPRAGAHRSAASGQRRRSVRRADPGRRRHGPATLHGQFRSATARRRGVGLAGLLGSGRTETCKLVFGAVHRRRRASSLRRQADRASLAATSGAAGHRLLPRGSQGRRDHSRTHRARKHRARAAGQARMARPPVASTSRNRSRRR